MALLYTADLPCGVYDSIVGWTGSYTYTRMIASQKADLPGHYPNNASTYELSITDNMFPLMVPFPTACNPIGYQNDGFSTTVLPRKEVASATDVGFDSSIWTYERLLAYVVPIWNQAAAKYAEWRTAYTTKKVEDTWQSKGYYWSETGYQDDIALGSLAYQSLKSGSGRAIVGSFEQGTDGKLVVHSSVTPCFIEIYPRFKINQHSVVVDIEGVIAYNDSWLPEVELVEHETGEFLPYPATYGVYIGTPITSPTALIFAPDADLLRYSDPINWQRCNVSAMHAAAQADMDAYLAEKAVSYPKVSFEMDGWNSSIYYLPYSSGISYAHPLPPALLAEHFPTQQAEITAWQDSINPDDLRSEAFSLTAIAHDDDDGGALLPTLNHSVSYSYRPERPKAWKFDDPDFIGYIPFEKELFEDYAWVLTEYMRNPSNIFDGRHFRRKLKISTVTRAWNGVMQNKLADANNTWFSGPFQASLTLNEQQYLSDGTPYNRASCSGMTPITWPGIFPFAPELNPGFWEEYPWETETITLEGGEFLLEAGSEAPVYPTMYGAYVYDTHLKKWGKLDATYKRLVDYSAINAFKPGEQSYARFGVFAGILLADGSVRIFDKNQSDSYITYGKIGYYRQGQTSVEEVRAHMREASAGYLKVESSVEGDRVTTDFSLQTNIPSATHWQHNGGYAGKWHTITIGGTFDLKYLEFRGIKSGKR